MRLFPRSEVRSQGPGIGDQELGARDQGSGVRGRRLEGEDRKMKKDCFSMDLCKTGTDDNR